MSRLRSKLPPSRAEQEVIDRYLAYARAGHEFITVHVADKDQIERIGDFLAESDAHSMRYFGRWTTRQLGGQRAPSGPASTRGA